MIRLLTLSILLVAAACSRPPEKEIATDGYTLHIQLSGVKDSTRFYLSDPEAGKLIDTAMIIDQQLHFSGSVPHPILVLLTSEDGLHHSFWLENEAITIVGKAEELRYAEMEGSSLNSSLMLLRKRLRPLEEEYDSLLGELAPLMDTGRPEEAALVNALNSNVARQKKAQLQFLYEQKEHSYFTLDLLYSLRTALSQDSLQQQFEQFPEALQNTPQGQVIRTIIEAEKAPALGEPYVDVSGLDTNGQVRRLSEVAGRYTLLEFWASWCGPCRVENPELINIYNEFKSEGFEIYGFSIDDREAAWRRALQEDKLPWVNTIAEHGRQSAYLARYQVQSIPANFLIDPAGRIVGVNLRGEALRKRLTELLKKG